MERIVEKTITLSSSIKEGEKEISCLEFIKPKVKHLQGIDLSKLSDTNNLLKLTQALTSVDVKALREMDLKDLVKVGEVINSFLEGAPKTETSGTN